MTPAHVQRKPWTVVGVLLFLICRAAFAFTDDFGGGLSAWDPPQVPLPGSSVSAPVADPKALDGAVVELVFPGRMSASYSGPEWATQIQTTGARQYGVYEARLRPAAAIGGVGVVSAVFTYFNDGLDHDGDGLVDNHEIDFEFLAAEPAAIYLTVWTAYEEDASGCGVGSRSVPLEQSPRLPQSAVPSVVGEEDGFGHGWGTGGLPPLHAGGEWRGAAG